LAIDRDRNALAGLNLQGLGLEIGPSHSPIAAGLPGVNCKVLDHSDQAELIRKYEHMGTDTSRIQPVDYVWSGQRYLDLVGDTRFDWIIASHVIEHVPDIVGFLNQCAEILNPGGIISLVAPDKRESFDYYRPPAGLSAVVDAHVERRKLSSAGAIAEFEMFYAEFVHGQTNPPMPNTSEYAIQMMKKPGKGVYHDVHAWVFTPSSFRLLIEDLYRLELLDVREAGFAEVPHEFYVKLAKEGRGPDVGRAVLAQRAVDELAGSAGVPPVAQEHIARLEREKAELEAELAATRATLSWRVTAPLRAVRRGVR
jgi:SAM-dependent methyltransferase